MADLPERCGRGDLRRNSAAGAGRLAPAWVSEAFYTPLPEPGRGALLVAEIGLLLALARQRGRFPG